MTPLSHAPFTDAVRQQLLGAMDDMCYPPHPDRMVHDVRIAGKRVRAALKLLRPAMGEDAYARENAAVRDLGRLFRERRDSHVALETLKGVRDDPAFAAARITALCDVLQGEAQQAVAATPMDEAIDQVRDTLFTARRRIEELELDSLRPGEAFRRLFKAYRKACAEARDHPDTERLHEWRKRTKTLRYALKALKDVWPKRVQGWCQALKDQGDLLGRDHDLALLAERVSDDDQKAHIAACRALVQKQVFEAAKAFDREKPSHAARRLGRHWKTWRAAA